MAPTASFATKSWASFSNTSDIFQNDQTERSFALLWHYLVRYCQNNSLSYIHAHQNLLRLTPGCIDIESISCTFLMRVEAQSVGLCQAPELDEGRWGQMQPSAEIQQLTVGGRTSETDQAICHHFLTFFHPHDYRVVLKPLCHLPVRFLYIQSQMDFVH